MSGEAVGLPSAAAPARAEDRAADLERIALELSRFLPEKNRAYGDSFGTSGQALALLYPEGVQPAQYVDVLLIVRIWDKLQRIATDRSWGGESPYRDIAGYGILGESIDGPRRAQAARPAAPEPKATHRCKVCGALWERCEDEGCWHLRSKTAGPCCDNAPMSDQIEPLGPIGPALAISATAKASEMLHALAETTSATERAMRAEAELAGARQALATAEQRIEALTREVAAEQLARADLEMLVGEMAALGDRARGLA